MLRRRSWLCCHFPATERERETSLLSNPLTIVVADLKIGDSHDQSELNSIRFYGEKRKTSASMLLQRSSNGGDYGGMTEWWLLEERLWGIGLWQRWWDFECGGADCGEIHIWWGFERRTRQKWAIEYRCCVYFLTWFKSKFHVYERKITSVISSKWMLINIHNISGNRVPMLCIFLNLV